MEPLSKQILNYNGANPFHEVQVKTYGEEKLLSEFFPTSVFLSLLNEQHEVLIGTRGSGKTAILRMLSYSCLRKVQNPEVKEFVKQHRFIGFYIPLHIEWMKSLPQDPSKATEYFQFAFNCKAAQSLIDEIKVLIRDLAHTAEKRLEMEGRVLTRMAKLWLNMDPQSFAVLEDISYEIECRFNNQQPWRDKDDNSLPIFAKPILAPILSVLPYIARDLGIDPQKTHWLACVDEAEFLEEIYIKCFNTFMRSDKRPIVLKLATMPYKYSTRETLIPGIMAESNGNDFYFRPIDLAWDSTDSINLTDHLANVRLKRNHLFDDENITLDNFIGKIGADDPKDYFRLEIAAEEATDAAILEGILKSLSPKRRENYEKEKEKGGDEKNLSQAYFKRYSPVYYVRRIREELRGNRSVGWFSGPAMIRRVADGNPRRFISMMRELFESARKTELTTKEQHRVVTDFADREYPRAEGLPEYGRLLKGILDTLGELMSERVHGKEMVDGGIGFSVHSGLLQNKVIRSALEQGVAYSYLFVDGGSLLEGFTEKSDFRTAHLSAVKYWLPMRKGQRLLLKSPHSKQQLANLARSAPATTRESNTILGVLQLSLFEDET
jgi:hypothetical protein